MLSIAHDPLPFVLLSLKEGVAHLGRHIFVPRRVPAPSLLGHGQIPFCESSYAHAPVGVCGCRVDNFNVPLEVFVEHVVAIGIVPPNSDPISIWPQTPYAGVCERGEPDLGEGMNIV
jgi:hypothetical protein